jgi:hypothetical protein
MRQVASRREILSIFAVAMLQDCRRTGLFSLSKNNGPSDLLALEHELGRISTQSETIYSSRLLPNERRFYELVQSNWPEAWRFNEVSGRADAVLELISLRARAESVQSRIASMEEAMSDRRRPCYLG